VQRGLLDVLPGFSYSANAGDDLVYPMEQGSVDPGRAIMADNVSLYVRAGDTRVHWDGISLSSPNPRVGTSTGGAATEETAQKFGFPLETAATPRTDLDKLLAGRIDVIMEPDVVMTPLLAGELGLQVRKLLPPARQSLRYAAVRKGFAAQYPAFTQRFWRELCVASRAGGTALPACR
jgi:ABC-type amino acid transport substrate-binding protein